MITSDKKGIDTTHLTSTTRSNSVLVYTLMRFIDRIAEYLKTDIRPNMPTILVPLLERASAAGNHSSVQTCAFETISNIAFSSGYLDVFSLLKDNFDYIMGHISVYLRRHSKDRTPASGSLMGVIDVVLRCAIRDKHVDQSQVPLVGNILGCLLNHFDRLTDDTRIQSFDTISVFQSIGAFMEASVDSRTASRHFLAIEPEQNCDWRKQLDMGFRDHSTVHDTSESPSMSDDFDAIGVDGEHQPNVCSEIDERDEALSFLKEISAINGISKRCIYLLCHQDLRIQVLCIDILLVGFRSLGKIGAHCKSVQGESASNPLLPEIAECWPSILVRLKETSYKLRSKKMLSRAELSIRHMMAADQDRSPSDASLIVLLSKLLGIISELCVISDGFFAGRFEKDVYPILATIMGDVISVEMDSAAKNNSSRSSLCSTNRHSALDPVLKCIKCVYKSSCKFALARLISPCGTIILPLLAHQGRIGDEAADALKAMLSVDSDVLWRQIHKLSGEHFPDNPLECADVSKSPKRKSCNAVVGKFNAASSAIIMAQRASKLLEFIQQLPEQEV